MRKTQRKTLWWNLQLYGAPVYTEDVQQSYCHVKVRALMSQSTIITSFVAQTDSLHGNGLKEERKSHFRWYYGMHCCYTTTVNHYAITCRMYCIWNCLMILQHYSQIPYDQIEVIPNFVFFSWDVNCKRIKWFFLQS